MVARGGYTQLYRRSPCGRIRAIIVKGGGAIHAEPGLSASDAHWCLEQVCPCAACSDSTAEMGTVNRARECLHAGAGVSEVDEGRRNERECMNALDDDGGSGKNGAANERKTSRTRCRCRTLRQSCRGRNVKTHVLLCDWSSGCICDSARGCRKPPGTKGEDLRQKEKNDAWWTFSSLEGVEYVTVYLRIAGRLLVTCRVT